MDIGFPAQQRGRINAGAMGLVAELDAAEITLGPLFAYLGNPEPSPECYGGGGGSCCPSLRSREALESQGCSGGPSTEKFSSLSNGLTSGVAISFSNKRPITQGSLEGRQNLVPEAVLASPELTEVP